MSEDLPWPDVQAAAAKGKEAKLNAQHVLDLLQELRDAEKDRDAVKGELEKMKQDFAMQSIQLEKLGEEVKKASKTEDLAHELAALKTEMSQVQADASAKQQFITQLEKDLAETREKVEDAKNQLKAADVDTLRARMAELDGKAALVPGLERENADLKAKLEGQAVAGQADFEREKAEFEQEKKRLFKEMEDFEVGLRMEMEGKDQQIADLEAALKSPGARGPEVPPPKAAMQAAAPEPTRDSMLARLGLGTAATGGSTASSAAAIPDDGVLLVSSSGRIVCPKCGNTDVKVESDRSRVLSYMGGVPYYAKKYSCKKCQVDFRVD